MIFQRIAHAWPHLGESVRSQYGPGLWGYVKFIYYTCLRVNTFILYAQVLSATLTVRPQSAEFRFMELTPAELDPYRQDHNLPKEFFADKAGGYSLCHVVFQGMDLAYIHWLSQAGEKTRFLAPQCDVVEIGYITTLPAFRQRGICAYALTEAFVRLQRQGIKKVVAVVHDENIASRKVMERVGMKEEAKLRTLGPFNLRYRVKHS